MLPSFRVMTEGEQHAEHLSHKTADAGALWLWPCGPLPRRLYGLARTSRLSTSSYPTSAAWRPSVFMLGTTIWCASRRSHEGRTGLLWATLTKPTASTPSQWQP